MHDDHCTADAQPHRHANALAAETSPYLLQHAHNPVDWHAWGPAAFALAKAQNKPIFLSVGYSTCYWCHVMERESFENQAVAAEMNRRFVCIKVDREERPEVDQLYMTAVQLLTGQGGWPMSVFLLPDLRPFYGGTYFPPADAYGKPGFSRLLRAVDDAYVNNRDQCAHAAEALTARLAQLARPMLPREPITINAQWITQIIDRSIADYDPEQGGFGSAPKFPRQTLLQLLLAQNEIAPDDRRQKMVLHSLRAMAQGGIRDQLGGAFHRYSTDARWLVPHFEIMLYDNALLAWIYTEAYRQTEDRFYADTARGIMDFVLGRMTSPQGTFYTALDAETAAVEGATYLWTACEVESVLGTLDAEFFNSVYGLDRGPNFADPHHGNGQPDRNVLYLPKALVEVADELGVTEQVVAARLQPLRDKLLAARDQRKQPMLDTKILTSWNALMIRALAYGGQVLGEERYLQAAKKAADFLLEHHRDADGNLLRLSSWPCTQGEGWGEGSSAAAKLPGHLDDSAFFIQALLALEEAGGDEIRRDQAGELALRMTDQFADPHGAFFFTPAGQADLIVRQKIGSDSPLPSGNAVAAMVLLELGQKDGSARILKDFAYTLDNLGEGSSALLEAALWYVQELGPLHVLPGPMVLPMAPVMPEENPGDSAYHPACTDKGCVPSAPEKKTIQRNQP